MHNPLFSSAIEMASAIKQKDISAVELVERHLARIEQVNAKTNAVVQLCAERALEEAREADKQTASGASLPALHGVPFTLKDSIDTADVITTYGTVGRKNFVPARDATVAARLRAAGAILMGKTNTPEFTLAFKTSNNLFQPLSTHPLSW